MRLLDRLAMRLGRWWLSGAKYRLSRELAGPSWDLNVFAALAIRGQCIGLSTAASLEDVVGVFRGRYHWLPDPGWQLWDRVYPPKLMLERGGGDCDDWAMAHAQAVDFALGDLGWQAFIVSYLADPWWLSHHFAVAIDPSGAVWAIQPQPTPEQPRELEIVLGPFKCLEAALRAVADSYRVMIVWYDVRQPNYEPMAQ